MRVHEFLIILFTIGLVALQPGEGALQCYKCSGESCKEQKLLSCDSADTTPATTPATTPSKATTPATTPSKATTPATTPSKATTPSSTSIPATNKITSLDAMNIDRKRRSVIDRFSRIQLVNDNVTYYCYSETVDGKETKGCTEEKDFCKDKDSCNICKEDGCNSATSTVVFTSMIFSLAVVVLFVR